MISLGETVKRGVLEIKPLEIVETRVRLVHTILGGDDERRDEGEQALALKLLIRNASDDVELYPLDESLVRDHERALPDSFIESEDGERVYLYSLAPQSEWSIEGQDFRMLKPGESYEIELVTTPKALEKLKRPGVWRFRIRTDLEKTELMAVRFQPTNIRLAPPEEPFETPNQEGKEEAKE